MMLFDNIKVALFDMDGTLVNSESISTQAFEKTIRHFYTKFSVVEKSSFLGRQNLYPDVIGRAIHSIVLTIVEKYFSGVVLVQSDREKFIADFTKKYFEFYHEIKSHPKSKDTFVMPESVQFLRELHDQGAIICIVSGSTPEEISANIAIMKIHDCVAHTWGDGEYTEGKPDPSPYTTAFSFLNSEYGVTLDECIVFEDSSAGVSSAVAAGIRVVGIAANDGHHQALESHGADLIVSSLMHPSLTLSVCSPKYESFAIHM